ncbi:MAG TPA: CehA/McbA family metallohydrolase [Chloroflexota bacterium]|nr:CehA/McbA family metallohydrolase [Chloroflexota bacterium]
MTNLLGDGAVLLRANLHGHTTGSDGRLSPQAYVDWYAARGYDALAITDHNVLTDPKTVDARGMLLLPGVEVTATGAEFGGQYHLVALGPLPEPLPPVTTAGPESGRLLRAAGAVVIVAHPHWSGLTGADLLGVEAATGVEIWNGGTVLDSAKGVALAAWDEALRRGRRIWGFATDDAHFRFPDGELGWVVLHAAERSVPAALAALRQGHFYGSAGPQLQAVRREGNTLTVACSPCTAIYCLGFAGRNQYRLGTPEAPLQEAAFALRGDEPWVRVQVTDAHGRAAWSQPFWLTA